MSENDKKDKNIKSKARRRLLDARNANNSKGKKNEQKITIEQLAKNTQKSIQNLQAQINKLDATIIAQDIVIQNQANEIYMIKQVSNNQNTVINDILEEMDLEEEPVKEDKKPAGKPKK